VLLPTAAWRCAPWQPTPAQRSAAVSSFTFHPFFSPFQSSLCLAEVRVKQGPWEPRSPSQRTDPPCFACTPLPSPAPCQAQRLLPLLIRADTRFWERARPRAACSHVPHARSAGPLLCPESRRLTATLPASAGAHGWFPPAGGPHRLARTGPARRAGRRHSS